MANYISTEGLKTPEEFIQKLKDAVEIRNKMGGALYYNILNDDCCEIARHCLAKGCNRNEIEDILGKGTFY